MGRLRREGDFVSACLPSMGVVHGSGILRPILKAISRP